MAFFVAMEEKIALPPFGGTFGGNGGPGKIISPVAGSAGEGGVEKSCIRTAVRIQLFSTPPCRGLHESPLSTRSPYHLYSFSGVRHVCHANDG